MDVSTNSRIAPLTKRAHAAASAQAYAIWVAVCSAAPDLIWQGGKLVLAELSAATMVSWLLIGLVLAFFIEPLFERLRCLVHGIKRQETNGLIFTACIGVGFAVSAVSLDETMAAYFAARPNQGVPELLILVASALVLPFLITLSWLKINNLLEWLALGCSAMGFITASGLLFHWSWATRISTAVPSIVLLLIARKLLTVEDLSDGDTLLKKLAIMLVLTAGCWLAFASAIDVSLNAFGGGQLVLYPNGSVWVDFRYYAGWATGLLLAPRRLNSKE